MKTRDVTEEATLEQKTEAWRYALGMIKIDGLTPSREFMELVEKEKRGEVTTADIRKALNRKYRMKKTDAANR